MPLKVWQFDPAHMTPYYDRWLCEALASAGCDVRLVASRYLYDSKLPPPSCFKTDDHYFRLLNSRRLLHYPRFRQALRGLSYPLDHLRLLNKLAADPPDVFHVQWTRLPLFDAWLLDRVRALGIPIVYTVHETIPLFAPMSVKRRLERVYRKADALIFHAEANCADFCRVFPTISADRLHVIPHLMPLPTLPVDANRDIARRRLNLPADAPIFLFFGSLRPYKGVDLLLDAFARAVKARPDLRLVIAGSPVNAADPALVDRLKTCESGVDARLEYIPSDEAWLYHVAADVVVFPYRRIYQSGALLTAMSYGRAVIATAVGALPETVDGNGWIVSPDDPAAFAEAMLDAASDPERLEAKGRRSLALIRERHDSADIAERTVTLYETLGIKTGRSSN